MLSSTNTTSEYHGWLELSVTDGIAKWLANDQTNKGIYIGAHAVDRPEHEVKLDDIGLVNTKGDDEYQPFMIGYFKSQNMVKPIKHNRSKRSAPRRRKKSELRNPYLEHRPNDNHKSCQIQTLYVSFRDLNWQVIVIFYVYKYFEILSVIHEICIWIFGFIGLDYCTRWIWSILL